MASCTNGGYIFANVNGTINCCTTDNCNFAPSTIKIRDTISYLGLIIACILFTRLA